MCFFLSFKKKKKSRTFCLLEKFTSMTSSLASSTFDITLNPVNIKVPARFCQN